MLTPNPFRIEPVRIEPAHREAQPVVQHVFLIATPGGTPARIVHRMLMHPAAARPPLESMADEVVAPQDESPPREKSFRELVRKLAPEPGFWRVVRYADFIDAITPQLTAAQRLRPSHQLACYVQVYELAAKTALATLEQEASRELGPAGKLVPLSYELCRRFGLSLPRPAFALAATQAFNSPGTVFPGARFITLRVAIDPTVESAGESATPTPVVTPPVPPPVSAPKAEIPEEYTKPWNFRLSRDEAVYDISMAATRGAVRRSLAQLLHGVSSRDLQRWQALLAGKTPDQQLWSVKPPRGAFDDARIRRWLEHVLELGGYDVPRMRTEWEIHWRRQMQ